MAHQTRQSGIWIAMQGPALIVQSRLSVKNGITSFKIGILRFFNHIHLNLQGTRLGVHHPNKPGLGVLSAAQDRPCCAEDPFALSVALLGLGAVGRELMAQLRASRDTMEEHYGLRLDLCLVADSSGYCVCKDWTALNSSQIEAVLASKKSGQSLSAVKGLVFSPRSSETKLWAEIEAARPGPGWLLVDCSCTEATSALLVRAATAGAAVVLANKKPLTCQQEVFARLTSPATYRRLRYESTVGAGTPMVAVLSRLRFSCDTIHKVQGSFSGTLGFIMAGLENGQKPFSALVEKAGTLGYTEPDPRDDLGGVDVARKALIIARTLGWRLELADVQVEALFPDEFASLSVPQFLARLHELDAQYALRVDQAKKQDQVLRYVATLEDGKCSVGLRALPKESPLGRLQGTQNMVEFHTRIFSPEPLVLQGAGAGAAVTAAGVLADMSSVFHLWMSKPSLHTIPLSCALTCVHFQICTIIILTRTASGSVPKPVGALYLFPLLLIVYPNIILIIKFKTGTDGAGTMARLKVFGLSEFKEIRHRKSLASFVSTMLSLRQYHPRCVTTVRWKFVSLRVTEHLVILPGPNLLCISYCNNCAVWLCLHCPVMLVFSGFYHSIDRVRRLLTES
eukprot:g32983.t1